MSSASDAVTIRKAVAYADYLACQEAQRRAWGIAADGYLVPVATMVGAQLHGGLVLGAFRPDGSAVGLSFAFLGRIDGRLCLYSQLTGVTPEYQSQGIGARLKQAQWEYAREQGLALLAWAYDPLQAANAAFNLRKLGAVATRYIVDMYGPRTDALNVGTPTDRLIVEWSTQPRAEQPPSDDATAAWPSVLRAYSRPDGLPAVEPVDRDLSAPGLRLPIPASFNDLRQRDPALAERWRLAVRQAFQTCFAAGYRADGFRRPTDAAGATPCYLLSRRTETA
jgi:predicted GNAT superfamily acetyltransferase